ncbi:MAG: glycosyltransferase family 2 protein [Porticoccaceae bacterium]|nr:glycosyltransferase family 2 protein [Porticoccaceae bacterium]
MECISVIVCCYNAEETISDTLSSLRLQTWTDLEVLVIDDGSEDNSAQIVRDIATQDSRIRILQNERNCGTAFTRQRGLNEARSNLIIYFDSDDIARPEMLSSLYELLKSDELIMGVSCYAEYFDGHDVFGIQRVGSLDKSSFMESWKKNKLFFQSMVTLTYCDLVKRVGGFRLGIFPNIESIRYEDFCEDLDLWCRMSDLAGEGRYFLTIPQPLFHYRKPINSLSTRNLRLMQLKMRWIKDCLLRRRSGRPERSIEEFIHSRSLLDRIHDWRSDRAAECYKKAGFCYSRRNWLRLALYLGMTGFFSPKLVRQKLRTQMVKLRL